MNALFFPLLMVFAWNIAECDMPRHAISVQCYPEVLQTGDTVYIKITARNVHDIPIWIPEDFSPIDGLERATIYTDILEWKTPLLQSRLLNRVSQRELQYVELKSGEERVIGLLKFMIPPLEQMQSEIFKSFMESTPSEGKELTIRVRVQSISCLSDTHEQTFTYDITALGKIRLKPRNEEETALIDQWYRRRSSRVANPKIIVDSEGLPIKKIGCETFEYFGINPYPEMWQGWKELEESLTPSTMRDEIRMTRIVIQYCDTEDSKVLDELTEWLQNMNEIQRVVMVQNVMNLPSNFPQDGEVRKPLLQLIETIKPFSAEELPAEIPAETGK